MNVRVARTQGSVVNNREMPDICLQHMVAVMLVDKTATCSNRRMTSRACRTPKSLRVRAKVNLILDDDELQRALPRREAVVEIKLKNGTALSEHVKAVRGTPSNPMTREEVKWQKRVN